jgi:hypothetical protein
MNSVEILREFLKQANDPFSTPIGKGWMGPTVNTGFNIHGTDEFRPTGDKFRRWGNYGVRRLKQFGNNFVDAVNPVNIYNDARKNVAENAAFREKKYGKKMSRAQNVLGPILGVAMLGGLGYGGYKAFPYAKKGLGLLRKLLTGGKG